MKYTSAYYDLLEGFAEEGCTVCRWLRGQVARSLDSLLYERVIQPPVQAAFRASRGLCAQHAHQMQDQKGGALGLAILYGAALDEVMGIVGEGGGGARAGFSRLFDGQQSGDLAPQAACPVCATVVEQEEVLLKTLVSYADDDKLMDAYRGSDGLCLPHVERLMPHLRGGARRTLLAIQQEHWAVLRAELAVYVEKNDYRRMDIEMGAERDSWRRALRMVSGDPAVFGVRRG